MIFLHDEEKACKVPSHCTQAPAKDPVLGWGNLTTALPGVENALQWKTILTLKVHGVCVISRVTGATDTQESRSRRGFETKAADSAFTSFLRGSGCRVTQELIPTSQV